MRRLTLIVVLLLLPVFSYSAYILRKPGVEDIYFATGGTGAAETATDNGITTTKIDATHIKLRSSALSVEDAFVLKGVVTNLEFSYLAGVTSFIQSQLNAKQTNHAKLTALSGSSANRFFYTDNNDVLQTITITGDNVCIKVNSGIPALGSCGSGGGVGSLNNTTMDNTVIGGTTPAAATFSTITVNSASSFGGLSTFSSGSSHLDNQYASFGTGNDYRCRYNSTTKQFVCSSTTTGSDMADTDAAFYFKFADGGTIDAGQRIFAIAKDTDNTVFYVDDVGNVHTTGELYAAGVQTSCSAADSTCGVDVTNVGPPTGANRTAGLFYFDNTANAPKQVNNDNTAILNVNTDYLTILPSGSNPTVDGSGEMGVDNTADQLVYFGTAERVLTYQHTKDFVIYGYSASHDNVVKWKADTNQTLTQLDCITGGTDNVTVTLYEADASAANLATTGLVAAATSSGASDSSASNGSIDVNDWVVVSLSSLQGTATSVACTVRYVITRQ